MVKLYFSILDRLSNGKTPRADYEFLMKRYQKLKVDLTPDRCYLYAYNK